VNGSLRHVFGGAGRCKGKRTVARKVEQTIDAFAEPSPSLALVHFRSEAGRRWRES